MRGPGLAFNRLAWVGILLTTSLGLAFVPLHPKGDPMPDQAPETHYPTRNELLRFVRAVLDQKPQAIKLVKDLVSQFQVPTLEASLNLARAYLDSLASDGK